MFRSELRLYIREIVVLNVSLLPSVHTLFDFLLATYDLPNHLSTTGVDVIFVYSVCRFVRDNLIVK